ncbi:MAG: type VI secretion system tip protein TssI/VgrG [Polyangiaceae bacterium]
MSPSQLPSSPDRPFSFAVDPFPTDRFVVHRLRGSEALSKPFAFVVDVTCAEPATHEQLESALGKPAAVGIHLEDAPARLVRGLVVDVRELGSRNADRVLQLQFRIVPRLWLLSQRRRSRIFQDLRVDEIVAAVLREWNVASRFELSRSYPAREYCTQYDETDLDFVTRLLAEEGIFFYFAHPEWVDLSSARLGDAETIVLIDEPHGYGSIHGREPAKLTCVEGEGLAGSSWDKVIHFVPRSSVRTNAAEFRDYDPRRPLAELRGRAAATGAGTDTELEVYEHHGRYRLPSWGTETADAGNVLRAARRSADCARGESRCTALAPGLRFRLEGSSSPRANRTHVVTSVRHQGGAGLDGPTYQNEFRTVPSDVPFVARPKRTRNVLNALTATVVGPPGEEIHVDERGQIKVQFHWDRDGKHDERSSCWIRTLQSWGGAGWGTQYIPRVGMEVTVLFEGGDPDRPIVLGSLHNGTHPPAFQLPEKKTKSGVRSSSTPGGKGYSEISIDDQAGSEILHVRAQRDLTEVVVRNRDARVMGNDAIVVDGTRHEEAQTKTQRVRGLRSEEIDGESRTRVGKSAITRIEGNLEQQVAGAREARIGGAERVEVGGRAELAFNDDVTTRVRGCQVTVVGRDEARRSSLLHVQGVSRMYSADTTEITSEKEILLRCGKSMIRLAPDRVEIISPNVAARGDGGGLTSDEAGFKISATSEGIFKGKSLVIKTEDASMSLAKEVQIDGKKILLNSPDMATDPKPKKEPPPTRIALKDGDGRPLAYQRFFVKCADGSEQSGIVGKDGVVDVEIPAGGEIVFPDLKKAKGT